MSIFPSPQSFNFIFLKITGPYGVKFEEHTNFNNAPSLISRQVNNVTKQT
jgi:hypothetical protein